jgi:hypothetical protein
VRAIATSRLSPAAAAAAFLYLTSEIAGAQDGGGVFCGCFVVVLRKSWPSFCLPVLSASILSASFVVRCSLFTLFSSLFWQKTPLRNFSSII